MTHCPSLISSRRLFSPWPLFFPYKTVRFWLIWSLGRWKLQQQVRSTLLRLLKSLRSFIIGIVIRSWWSEFDGWGGGRWGWRLRPVCLACNPPFFVVAETDLQINCLHCRFYKCFRGKFIQRAQTSAQNLRNLDRLEIKNLSKDMMCMNGKHAPEATKKNMHSLNGQSLYGECWIKTDADCKFKIPYPSNLIKYWKNSKACTSINLVCSSQLSNLNDILTLQTWCCSSKWWIPRPSKLWRLQPWQLSMTCEKPLWLYYKFS